LINIKNIKISADRSICRVSYIPAILAKFFQRTFIHCHATQGYTKPREYIVTEWPLRHTCGEFWSLVYDYECAAVVVLCVPPQGSTNFPSFWPEGRHSKKYGPVFTIDHISHNHYTNIKTWVRINSLILVKIFNSRQKFLICRFYLNLHKKNLFMYLHKKM